MDLFLWQHFEQVILFTFGKILCGWRIDSIDKEANQEISLTNLERHFMLAFTSGEEVGTEVDFLR